MNDTNEHGVSDPTGVTGQLSNFLSSLTLDDVPAVVVQRSEHLILDGVGCGLLAAHLPWSQRAVDSTVALEGEGPATVWGWDAKVPAPAAALLNGTFVQGFELDDYHPFGPLHSEACVIPSVLATAEHLGGVDGGTFLLAVIAGFETGPRVGMGLGGLSLVSRGWHCGAVYGSLASAAGASKVWGLDPAGHEDALGIAATSASGLMSAQYEAMVKRMHSGMAARNGLYASALAAGGFSGIKRVIEREYGGLASTFAGDDPVFLDRINHEIGDRWEILRIAVKPPYACMGGLHSTIDGALSLRSLPSFDANEIDSIDISVPHAMYHHAGWQLERPAEVIGAQMNLAYAAAVALIDGAAFVPQFSPARIDSQDIWNLIDRTSVSLADDLDGLGEQARWTSRLRLTMGNGDRHEVEVAHPWGGVERPMTNDELVEKFLRMASLVIEDQRRIDRVVELVLGLRRQSSLGELVELLGAPVKSPY